MKTKFSFLIKDFKKVDKILFCSVVPKTFYLIRKFLRSKTKKKYKEIKNLNLNSLINIDVNFQQVGSDRLTNAISLANGKSNYIILDFGTATTFDVLIKNTYKGGIIAPGIEISLSTLSDRATLIPKIILKKIKNVVGKDILVCKIWFFGYAGLIDNIVYLIKKKLENPLN